MRIGWFFVLTLLISCQSVACQKGHLLYIKNGVPTDITYAEIDGLAIAEGDIILKELKHAKSKFENLPQAIIVKKISGARWDNGIIPFKFSTDLASNCQYKILDAMGTWQQGTQLKFIEVTSENSAQYKDYIYFTLSRSNNSSSYVGRQGGVQVIKINYKCKKMAVVHEIGHALGLWHEQSRADRDRYIKIIWDNIAKEHRFNFKQHLSDGEDVGEYDYSSVMHYSAYAFSKNKQKTIIPICPNSPPIGQRKKLSKKDIATINYMYPSSN